MSLWMVSGMHIDLLRASRPVLELISLLKGSILLLFVGICSS